MIKINRWTSILILILVAVALLAGYLIYNKYLGSQKVPLSQQLSPAEKSQYKFMAIAKDASQSAGQVTFAQKYHQFWRGRVTYLPLSDTFIGTVDENIDNIYSYRLAKKLIVENLIKRDINPCDLNIIWLRPSLIDKENFETQDVQTDGCTKK